MCRGLRLARGLFEEDGEEGTGDVGMEGAESVEEDVVRLSSGAGGGGDAQQRLGGGIAGHAPAIALTGARLFVGEVGNQEVASHLQTLQRPFQTVSSGLMRCRRSAIRFLMHRGHC